MLKFAAVDPNVQDDFATNLNVIVEELPAGTTLDDYEEAFVSQLQSLPNVVGAIDRQRVELPAGPALRASYKLTLTTSGKTWTVSTRQYALVEEGRAFILTYTTLPAQALLRRPFTRSAQSLRLTCARLRHRFAAAAARARRRSSDTLSSSAETGAERALVAADEGLGVVRQRCGTPLAALRISSAIYDVVEPDRLGNAPIASPRRSSSTARRPSSP